MCCAALTPLKVWPPGRAIREDMKCSKSHKNYYGLLYSSWSPSALDFVSMTRRGFVRHRWVKRQVKSTMHVLAVPDRVLSTVGEWLLRLQKGYFSCLNILLGRERKKKKGSVSILDKVWAVTCRWLDLRAVFSRENSFLCLLLCKFGLGE